MKLMRLSTIILWIIRRSHKKTMKYDEGLISDPSTNTDPQYMFLCERLKAFKDGWEELQQMWENR
ncbi:CLUMA_CG015556, isoform A [Clunio marinus]|uniref:CLUMA_CG005688, isoform A n=1 Tax=Clunio marinus TaxID=568069 RepID=A0A1J1IQF0_9DIPT|nr:CLUMA_CG005688, isoform A [Clunio marinus]CRL02459.1 CLUMA_CG015556, isoform A [Clunio marinus]